MKRTLQLIIFLLLSAPIFSQDITIAPDFVEFHYDVVQLANYDLDLEEHVTITNNTNETINLMWVRETPGECPDVWETQVCDNVQCYAEFVDSNFDEQIPVPQAFTLEPNESFDGFILHVLPRTQNGCCNPKIHFSRVEDPDVILATLEFEVKIQDPECLVSVDEVTKEALKVYPNPMTDEFRLAGNQDNVVNEVVVYNLIGRPVRAFNTQYESTFDMSGLPGGIYLVSLLGEGDEILKTVRISRQVMRP